MTLPRWPERSATASTPLATPATGGRRQGPRPPRGGSGPLVATQSLLTDLVVWLLTSGNVGTGSWRASLVRRVCCRGFMGILL